MEGRERENRKHGLKMHVVFLFRNRHLHRLIINRGKKYKLEARNEFNALNSICFVFSKNVVSFFHSFFALFAVSFHILHLFCIHKLHTQITRFGRRLTFDYFIEYVERSIVPTIHIVRWLVGRSAVYVLCVCVCISTRNYYLIKCCIIPYN